MAGAGHANGRAQWYLTWRSDFEDHQAAIAAEQDRRDYEAAKVEWQAAREKAKKRLDDAKAKLTATEKRTVPCAPQAQADWELTKKTLF